MNRCSSRTLVCLAGATLALIAVAVHAGPIDPPSGPVAPTAKPLSEIEPRIAINAANTPGDAASLFRITQPGSYYLAGNITGISGKHGIVIAAEGVTLDLNGFDLAGVPGMGGFSAIALPNNTFPRTISIRNGSVRGWGDSGIALSNASSASITDVRAAANGSHGIVLGTGAIVSRCTAESNNGWGILCSNGSALTNCTALNNTVGGLSAQAGAVITGCNVSHNTGIGIFGSNSSTVTGCTAYSNTGSGISVDTGCTVSNCTTGSNTVDGILAATRCGITNNTSFGNSGANFHATGSGNHIESNTCTGGGIGFQLSAAGNILIRNTASGSGTKWAIATGNAIGIIVLAGTNPSAISTNGNSGQGNTLGTSEPNANFSY